MSLKDEFYKKIVKNEDSEEFINWVMGVEDENELDNWDSWSDIVGSYRECDIFMGIMEKTCIKCKWYTEEKRFCKWVSGYTKNDFSCKFWRSKDVDNKNNSTDSNN